MPNVRDHLEQVHRKTVTADLPEIVRFLDEVLTKKLVAFMCDKKEPKTVARWASGDRRPDAQTEERLRNIYAIFQLLQSKESAHTVRSWFIGMNPQLDDVSPARAIRDGRVKDVMVAAKAWIAGG